MPKALSSAPSDLGEVAREMATRQRVISVSEFFLKNRHLLGFDSPTKALLIVVKEAVDNSLDACEEARILPEIRVEIHDRGEGIYRVMVEDDGPGIVVDEVGRVFGKLLYGSKFHKLSQTRGQQGIGISAAGMYGQLTTGKPVRVLTRTADDEQAWEVVLTVDTTHNRPDVHAKNRVDWSAAHGTRVEIELEAQYRTGVHSVETYLRQTAIANPHATLRYRGPDRQEVVFARSTYEIPPAPVTILPHPHGVELGRLIQMLKDAEQRSLKRFLCESFSRLGNKTALEVIRRADSGLSARSYPRRVARKQAVALARALAATHVSAPDLHCLSPIGEARILEGLRKEVAAEHYLAVSRAAAVYRGNPFSVEVGIAYGGPGSRFVVDAEGRIEKGHAERGTDELLPKPDEPARLLRFANRVPLLFEQGSCAMTKAVLHTSFKGYGLEQPKASLPHGPLVILLHVASVWVPFTSESKEAVAAYAEIDHELRLALHEAGRRLALHLRRGDRLEEEFERRAEIAKVLPEIGAALTEILDLDPEQSQSVESRLNALLLEKRSVL